MAFQVRYLNCTPELQTQVEGIIKSWNSINESFDLQTSGSTGAPKTITQNRTNFKNSAIRSNSFFGLHEHSHVLLAISPKFIGGMMVVIRALVGNYRVSVIDSTRVIELDEAEKFDFVSLVPLQIEKMRSTNDKVIDQFSTILLGGTNLSNSLRDFLLNRHSNCYIGFGMTETVSHIALRKISDDFYTCLEGVIIKEKKGQLIINDSFLGISNLSTTDEIKLLDEKHFYWLGRTDFTINSGGIKIHPEQIETSIREYVQGGYILCGIPDEKLGQKCILLLDVDSKLELPFIEIQQKIEDLFGKYAAPKSFVNCNFIYSENGKILRKETLQNYHESF